VNVQRFADVFWGPEDFLKINRDEVVWVTQLNEKSQLATFMSNRGQGTQTPPPSEAVQPGEQESLPAAAPEAAEE